MQYLFGFPLFSSWSKKLMSALNPIQLDPILELNCQINFHTFELIQVDLEAKYCEPMKKTKCRTSTHREVIVQVKNTLSYPF